MKDTVISLRKISIVPAASSILIAIEGTRPDDAPHVERSAQDEEEQIVRRER